ARPGKLGHADEPDHPGPDRSESDLHSGGGGGPGRGGATTPPDGPARQRAPVLVPPDDYAPPGAAPPGGPPLRQRDLLPVRLPRRRGAGIRRPRRLLPRGLARRPGGLVGRAYPRRLRSAEHPRAASRPAMNAFSICSLWVLLNKPRSVEVHALPE